MAQKILVLLGNENTASGELSTVAKLRADYAIALLKQQEDYIIIPTGAFGKHFNTSHLPHGELLTRYLIKNGVDKNRILPFVRSSNTVEDAYGVLRTLQDRPEACEIHVVSSNFHMKRVQYIFGRVFPWHPLEYFGVADPAYANRNRLDHHEARKLKQLDREWVDVAGFDLRRFPTESYENLGHALRHYDHLSYLALMVALVGYGYSCAHLASPVQYGMSMTLFAAFWYLYARLANTAAAAGRVMMAIEQLYGVPGLASASAIYPLSRTKRMANIRNIIGVLMVVLMSLLLFQIMR